MNRTQKRQTVASSEANGRTALELIRAEVRRQTSADDMRDIEMDTEMGVLWFSVRNLGDWEVPADEEDDGDYDWKVPTAATRAKLDEMIGRIRKQFPGLDVYWENEGEKNWLGFIVRLSAKK